MLLVTRNILRVYELSSPECQDYYDCLKVYGNLKESPVFRDIRIETLFENFDRRIEIAKNITSCLCNLEIQCGEQVEYSENMASGTKFDRSLRFSRAVRDVDDERKVSWKQAVKLALLKGIKSAKKL
jgi:hypothetical protein